MIRNGNMSMSIDVSQSMIREPYLFTILLHTVISLLLRDPPLLSLVTFFSPLMLAHVKGKNRRDEEEEEEKC